MCTDRDFVIAELIKAAKIATTILNLSDDERILNKKAVLIPWYYDISLTINSGRLLNAFDRYS
jgi:hypothetical protein